MKILTYIIVFLLSFIWFPLAPTITILIGIFMFLHHIQKSGNSKFKISYNTIDLEAEKRKEAAEKENLEKIEKLSREKLEKIKADIERTKIDYLEAFIERIGFAKFYSLDWIYKIDDLKNKLSNDDLNELNDHIKKLIEIVENGNVNNHAFEEIKSKAEAIELLEHIFLILQNLPKLRAVLSKNDINLNYDELIRLLVIKRNALFIKYTQPYDEGVYKLLQNLVFSILEKGVCFNKKINKNLIDDIIFVFVLAVTVCKKDQKASIAIDSDKEIEFLLRLLNDMQLIYTDLPREKILNLMSEKQKEVEIMWFEAELEKGIKNTPFFLADHDINSLTGFGFESFLAQVFKELGYSVVQTSLTGDQGADIIIEKNDEKIAVQAKKYNTPVSNKAVQEVATAVKYYQCDRGMVVTTSSFTPSAIQLAHSNNVELWDGKVLKKAISDLRSKSNITNIDEFLFGEIIKVN